jgi:hypothetical protein
LRHALYPASWRQAIVPPLLAVIWACGSDADARDSSAQASSIRDSAGIAIVESRLPSWESGTEWRVGQLLVSIGEATGELEYELFRVLDATRLSDGTVAVANMSTSEIRLFDAAGRFLRSLGRVGGGPGEFQAEGLRRVDHVQGDSLFAWDLLAQRMSVFAPDGEFVRSTRLRNTNRMYFFDGLFADRSMLMRLNRPDTSSRFVEGYTRNTVRFLRFGGQGDSLGRLGEFPGSEEYWRRWGERGMVGDDAPFGKVTSARAGPDRAYVATGDSYEVWVFSTTAELEMSIRKEHPPVPVSADVARGWDEERAARLKGHEPGWDYSSLLDDMVLPDVLPAYGSIQVDASSNLWVEEYDEAGERGPEWSVFDPRGVWLGCVRIPAGLEVFEIGNDYILGREVDDAEVEYVRVYELVKP